MGREERERVVLKEDRATKKERSDLPYKGPRLPKKLDQGMPIICSATNYRPASILATRMLT